MSIRMVRAKVRADKVADLEKAAGEMFAAIEAAKPGGVRYASCKLPDGETFVILLALDDDENNPLVAVQAFRDLMTQLEGSENRVAVERRKFNEAGIEPCRSAKMVFSNPATPAAAFRWPRLLLIDPTGMLVGLRPA